MMTAAYIAAAVGLLACGVGIGLWLSHTRSRDATQAMTPAPTLPVLTRQPTGAYEIRTSDGALVYTFSDGYAWKLACESLRGQGYRFLHNGTDRT